MKKDKIFGKEGISLGNYTQYEPIQYMNLQNFVAFTLWVPTLPNGESNMESYIKIQWIPMMSYSIQWDQ